MDRYAPASRTISKARNPYSKGLHDGEHLPAYRAEPRVVPDSRTEPFVALIAAGTGLGEAGLYWGGTAHRPFATEGGHASFAPSDGLQAELSRSHRRHDGHGFAGVEPPEIHGHVADGATDHDRAIGGIRRGEGGVADATFETRAGGDDAGTEHHGDDRRSDERAPTAVQRRDQ